MISVKIYIYIYLEIRSFSGPRGSPDMVLIAFHRNLTANKMRYVPGPVDPQQQIPQIQKNNYPSEGAHLFECNEMRCSVDGGIELSRAEWSGVEKRLQTCIERLGLTVLFTPDSLQKLPQVQRHCSWFFLHALSAFECFWLLVASFGCS